MPRLHECLIGTWQYDFLVDRLHLSHDCYKIVHHSVYNPIQSLSQFREIVHTEDLHLVSNERVATILDTKGRKIYIRLIGEDGRIRTCFCSADLIDDFDQKVPRLAGTIVDATVYLHRHRRVLPPLPHVTLGALLDSMQRLRCAALAINDRSEVVAMNVGAEAFLREGPLTLIERRLISTRPESNRQLQAFLAKVCSAHGPWDEQASLPIGVLRKGRRPLVIHAQLVGEALRNGPSHPKAIIGFVDLESSGAPRAEHVRSALNLTIAESRLALILMDHFRLREAASTLGISHETARTQLHSVFLKTGARNQADLLVMLERLGRGSSELTSYISLLGND